MINNLDICNCGHLTSCPVLAKLLFQPLVEEEFLVPGRDISPFGERRWTFSSIPSSSFCVSESTRITARRIVSSSVRGTRLWLSLSFRVMIARKVEQSVGRGLHAFPASARSVSGCRKSCSSTPGGTVATSAPMTAASSTWTGLRRADDHDLRLEPVVVVDADDLLDEIHADRADLVQGPDGRRDVGDVRFGGEQRLRRRVAARGAHGDLILREQTRHAQAVRARRQLDDDVLAELGELARLLVHALGVAGERLDADRAVRQRRELAHRAAIVEARGLCGAVGEIQTPSSRPQSFARLASSGLALSRKKRMGGGLYSCPERHQFPGPGLEFWN